MSFSNKLIVITGAASGIGRATARAFAARGARLAIADVDSIGLSVVVAELGKAIAHSRVVDVGDRSQMALFASEVHQLAPAADVVVNNAGVGQQGGMLATTLDSWDWLLRVNLMGVIHGCHFFAPAMVARRHGHIINVASVLGLFAIPEAIAYVTSKFAIVGMTLSLRSELAAHGVLATALCPGMIDTAIIRSGRFASGQDGLKDRLARQFSRRGASPSVVADAIVSVIGKDVAILPVTREAWALWGMSRVVPHPVMDAFTRSMAKRAPEFLRPVAK